MNRIDRILKDNYYEINYSINRILYTNIGNTLLNVVYFCIFCIFWSVLKLAIRNIITKNEIMGGNIFSLIHAIVVSIYGILCIFSNANPELLLAFSLSYFLMDMLINKLDLPFKVHHTFASISFIVIILNMYLVKPYLLIFTLGEISSPLQNYFFTMKTWYGDDVNQKKNFIKKYRVLFWVFVKIYNTARFYISPFVFCWLVYMTKRTYESYVFWIIGMVYAVIIYGSLRWSKGQSKKLKEYYTPIDEKKQY